MIDKLYLWSPAHDGRRKDNSLSMEILKTEIANRKKNKPFTVGPETEKLIIPGIGLIWAPVSLSITWR